MYYARIVDNVVVETFSPPVGFNIADCFHPELKWDTVPSTVKVGDTLNEDGSFTAAPLPPRTWVAEDIRKNLTFAEKVKWDSDKYPEAVTAKLELASPKEEAAVIEILYALVAETIISSASKEKILA